MPPAARVLPPGGRLYGRAEVRGWAFWGGFGILNLMNNLMTQAEFAALKGVGRSAVSNWKRQGHLVFEGGKVDVARTNRRLAERVDPTRGRPTTAQAEAMPVDAMTKVRTELLTEQATKARLQNDKLAGDLVPLAEFERRASEAGRLARERMHALARLQAERLAAETDPRAIVAILTTAMDEAFNSLAGQLEAEARAEAEADAAAAVAESLAEADDDDEAAAA